MSQSTKNSGLKIVVIILALLLAGLAFFTFQNIQKNKESEEVLMTEKLEIQADLDAKIVELDNAIADNTSIKDELISARDDIMVFRDSVKDLKTLKYQIIRRYKKKLASLEKINNKLLEDSELLKQENYALSVEVDSTKAEVQRQHVTIENQHKKNDSLSVSNTDLSNRISKGAALQIGNVAIVAMKEGRKGKLKKTTRAKKTDAFRISFKVRKNVIAEPGKKQIHIVIKDLAGKVIGGVDSFIDANEKEIAFSDETEMEYENEDKEVIVVTEIPEDILKKGNYYVDVYLEKKLLSSGKITLKGGWL